MTQLDVWKQEAKRAGDCAEKWRGVSTQHYNEKLEAQRISLILAVLLLASNGGWFCAFMWL